MYPRTEELRKRISQGMKTYLREHPRPPNWYKEIGWHAKGRPVSEKVRLAFNHKGTRLTEEHKHKIAEGVKKYCRIYTHHLKGKSPSIEAIQKMIATRKRLYITDPTYRAKVIARTRKMQKASDISWADPVKRQKRVEAVLKASWRRPTLIEERIINIIQNHQLPYRYVGDGQVIIGGKNPDFINCNGDKKLIDVFGDYWHHGGMQEEQERIRFFAEYGFQDLIIWAHQIKHMDDEQIASLVKDFGVRKVTAEE